MAKTTYVRITKDPQCRHADRFVTYAGTTNVVATCSNCNSSGAAAATQTLAKDALMRVIADPVVEP